MRLHERFALSFACVILVGALGGGFVMRILGGAALSLAIQFAWDAWAARP